jgi:hypothetical protein
MKYAIAVGRGSAKIISNIWSVGQQSAISDKLRVPKDRRHIVSRCQGYNQGVPAGDECIGYDDEAVPGSRPSEAMTVSISASL